MNGTRMRTTGILERTDGEGMKMCYDLIYNPEETLFMKNSAKYGAQTKNGIEMLLLQAFDSYRIWTEEDDL